MYFNQNRTNNSSTITITKSKIIIVKGRRNTDFGNELENKCTLLEKPLWGSNPVRKSTFKITVTNLWGIPWSAGVLDGLDLAATALAISSISWSRPSSELGSSCHACFTCEELTCSVLHPTAKVVLALASVVYKWNLLDLKDPSDDRCEREDRMRWGGLKHLKSIHTYFQKIQTTEQHYQTAPIIT